MCRKCFHFTLHLFISSLFPHCSPAERAWFRLSAGNAILKICEQKGVGDKYTLEQFYTFSRLFVDPVPQVRERILIKLHKVRERKRHDCYMVSCTGLGKKAGARLR